jgi:hypothetical protein
MDPSASQMRDPIQEEIKDPMERGMRDPMPKEMRHGISVVDPALQRETSLEATIGDLHMKKLQQLFSDSTLDLCYQPFFSIEATPIQH